MVKMKKRKKKEKTSKPFAYRNEPTKDTTVTKRHDQQDAQNLIDKLSHFSEGPKVRAPEMDEVVRTSAGRCGQCGKDIYDGTYSRAGNDVYHDNCFSCSKCNQKIAGGVERVGSRLVCSNCVALPKCKRCNDSIQVIDSFVAPSDDVKFHKTCTTCAGCKIKLDLSDVFFLKNDLYCKPCAEKL
jgi:hypothetical protein